MFKKNKFCVQMRLCCSTRWRRLPLLHLSQYKASVTPWVGLRKINVSYWCWEDMSPFTNTSLQWLPGEPSDAGFCGYLAEAASSGLKAQSCINPVNGSLCERPGGFPALHVCYSTPAKKQQLTVLLSEPLPQPTTAPSSAGRRAPWGRRAASAPAAAAPSACGAATWSSASTPTPTWRPSPSDSAWSGAPWTRVHVRPVFHSFGILLYCHPVLFPVIKSCQRVWQITKWLQLQEVTTVAKIPFSHILAAYYIHRQVQ